MSGPTVLLVAPSDSVHTARWVKHVGPGLGAIYVFPSSGTERVHPDLQGARVLRSCLARIGDLFARLGLPEWARRYEQVKERLERVFPGYRVRLLRNAIRRIHPDIVHSLNLLGSGWLVYQALPSVRTPPAWFLTIWGSDLYLYGRLVAHAEKAAKILGACAWFSCECARDVKLARDMGFKGTLFPPGPVTGGFDLARLAPLRSRPTSARRLILLKGYQGVTGRALCGLRALERCADALQGYELAVYSAAPAVAVAVELFTRNTGIAARILPDGTPHDEMLALQAIARISVSVGTSDGICVAMLEAMVMGAFPIQSATACADEWLEDGLSGAIVPPDDPDVIEEALRRALGDDRLVDEAAAINWGVATRRLGAEALRERDLANYRAIAGAAAAARNATR